MANYSLVINSQFKPFSFEDYVKPYQMYKSAYEALEDNYTKQAELSGQLDQELGGADSRDAVSRQMYDQYKSYLDQQVQDLSQNGLTINNRANLINTRKLYSTNVTPKLS